MWTGAKRPGKDMEERRASNSAPLSKATSLPELRSVATQRKGVERSSKLARFP